jgi:hypothetical protein
LLRFLGRPWNGSASKHHNTPSTGKNHVASHEIQWRFQASGKKDVKANPDSVESKDGESSNVQESGEGEQRRAQIRYQKRCLVMSASALNQIGTKIQYSKSRMLRCTRWYARAASSAMLYIRSSGSW